MNGLCRNRILHILFCHTDKMPNFIPIDGGFVEFGLVFQWITDRLNQGLVVEKEVIKG